MSQPTPRIPTKSEVGDFFCVDFTWNDPDAVYRLVLFLIPILKSGLSSKTEVLRAYSTLGYL